MATNTSFTLSDVHIFNSLFYKTVGVQTSGTAANEAPPSVQVAQLKSSLAREKFFLVSVIQLHAHGVGITDRNTHDLIRRSRPNCYLDMVVRSL